MLDFVSLLSLDLAQHVPWQRDWRSVTLTAGQALPDAPVDMLVLNGVLGMTASVSAYLDRAKAIIRPGGYLVIVDGVVPAGRKKHHQATRAYINALFRFIEPNHIKYRHQYAWQRKLHQAGFELKDEKQFTSQVSLDRWVDKLGGQDKVRLPVLVEQAPAGVRTLLTPTFTNDRIQICLTSILLIGTVVSG